MSTNKLPSVKVKGSCMQDILIVLFNIVNREEFCISTYSVCGYDYIAIEYVDTEQSVTIFEFELEEDTYGKCLIVSVPAYCLSGYDLEYPEMVDVHEPENKEGIKCKLWKDLSEEEQEATKKLAVETMPEGYGIIKDGYARNDDMIWDFLTSNWITLKDLKPLEMVDYRYYVYIIRKK